MPTLACHLNKMTDAALIKAIGIIRDTYETSALSSPHECQPATGGVGRVILVDSPGHGVTSGIINGSYSLAGFAAAIGEALVRVGRRHLGSEFGCCARERTTEDSPRVCGTTGLLE